MIWFQCLADASSARLASRYHELLPKLIADLRKDLDKPELPVVIAALAGDGIHASTIRDVQLAAHNPTTWIASIDTKPYLRSSEISPATRADICHQNTASCVDIG